MSEPLILLNYLYDEFNFFSLFVFFCFFFLILFYF